VTKPKSVTLVHPQRQLPLKVSSQVFRTGNITRRGGANRDRREVWASSGVQPSGGPQVKATQSVHYGLSLWFSGSIVVHSSE
jgi:hypothetical protein